MRTFALASGSSGNCFYIESLQGKKFLVDLGLSFNKTKEILERRKIDINEIDGVFITHEHSDHCIGLSNFIKNVKCDIYLTRGTLDVLDLSYENFKIIKNHSIINILDTKIFVVSKPHDSKEAVSYIFENGGKKLGIFTDLGYATDEIKHILKTLDIIYFETNYSKDIIKSRNTSFAGKYVSRLISDEGHLDLEEACEILKKTSFNEQKIILSHISENTNTYEESYSKVKNILNLAGKFPNIYVSFQKEPTQWIE